MNEDAAREVLLVRAIETGEAGGLLADSDRQHASRTAAELARWDASRGTREPAAEAFVAHRAHLLVERLGASHPPIARAARALSWRPAIGVAVALLALLTGLLVEQVADPGRVNLLAFPLPGIVGWNLLVYLWLLVAASRRALAPAGAAAPGPGPLRAALLRLATRASGRVRGPQASAVAAFVADWSVAVAPLARARAARVLHLAAALLALGAIAGLYLRGLVLEYRVGWESTFLEAPAVHALLATLLGPAAALLGSAVPDVATVAAIRFPAGATGAAAATWIHLHALTVGLAVVAPRLLLAAFAAARESRLARHLPVDLDAPYFRRLLAPFVGARPRLCVVPYSYAIDARVQAGLGRVAQALLGDAAQVEVLPAVAYGEEARAAEALVGVTAAPALLLGLFNLAATPEVENHGRFLEGLRRARVTAAADRDPAPASVALAVLVDTGPYAQRLGADAGVRLEERCRSWSAFVAARGLRCACVDLDAAPVGLLERELGPALAGRGP